MNHTTDFQIVDHGNVVVFTALNLDAEIFARNGSIPSTEDWQWVRGVEKGFAVDRRMALTVKELLIDNGFSVNVTIM